MPFWSIYKGDICSFARIKITDTDTKEGGFVDWSKIKTEYITDEQSSYRKLAEKYKISRGTLQKRASKEGWAALKAQSNAKVVSKTVEKIEEKKIDKLTRIQNITDKILDKIERAVEELDLQLCRQVDKVKEIEYNNYERPDKPTKEIVKETETVTPIASIIDRKGLQSITSALKDIKDIQMLKSELDRQEQEARIAKLVKDSVVESPDSKVVHVHFVDEMDDYSE